MVKKKVFGFCYPRWKRPPQLLIGLLLVLTMSLAVKAGKPRQQFATEPSPQTAVVGSTVVFPCRIINKVGELQWTRDGFGLGNERELFAFKRYGMIGADEEGDFSLKISPVELDDDAEFQCQVTGDKNVPAVRSRSAKLTVYVPPEPPTIVQGELVQSTQGAAVQLQCISKGGKPAAEIQWLDGSGRVIRDGVKYNKVKLEDTHTFDATSTLTFIADRQHHNALFTCVATNPSVTQSLRKQVRLEVTYPPQISINHDKQNGYKEGHNATLTCSAKANPNKLTFRWHRNGKLVSNANETRLVINNVSKQQNMEDITCEVQNEIGTSKKITRLDVHYSPKFIVTPKDEFAEEGDNVTLRCQVDGSPTPKIVWISQKNSTYIYESGPSLTLKASSETVGTYLCIAKVEGFEEITSTVGLFLKGPPVVRADRLQWGIVGDTTQVECYVPSATPNSVQISWSHNGKQIDFVNGRYTVEKVMYGDGVMVRLVIKQAKMEDFDTYNCSVQNAFGSDMVDVVLKRRQNSALLLSIGVIGLIVFFLVAAISCLYVYKRKSNKQKDAKSSGGLPEKNISLQMNDQNSTGNESDLKVELDNRTGSSMSAKDGDNDQSWEKDADSAIPPNYLSNTSAYLSPENFTNNSMKVNGHATNLANNLTYGDFTGPDVLSIKPTTPQQQNHNTSNYTNMSGGSFSPRSHGAPILTSSTHNLYPSYHHQSPVGNGAYEAQPTESVEGLRGLSSNYSNGFSNHNSFKNTSTLPLSLHINRNTTTSPSPMNLGNLGIPHSTAVPTSSTNTIPRLGIPVDPSQYIVPPRTQILQGTLATHV